MTSRPASACPFSAVTVVNGGVTTVTGFSTANHDPVVCVERMRSIGAAAMLSAGLQLDTAVVERRFDDLNNRFDITITEAFESIGELLDGDEGTIGRSLDRANVGRGADGPGA